MRQVLKSLTGAGFSVFAGLMPAAAGEALPGDAMSVNSRACFSYAPNEGGPIGKLLLELHKEQLEGQDTPVIWARVYAEKAGEKLAGYNYDGCSPYKDGGTSQKFDQLHCGFSCDAGALQIRLSGNGLAIAPENLFLRSCGVGEGKIGGFQIRAEDVNGTATVLPVDDAECRSVMAPMEKIMDDAEAGFE